jgi:hypothetical protein
MAERRNEDNVGIVWIDRDAADLARIAQAEVRPTLAAVAGLVNTVS